MEKNKKECNLRRIQKIEGETTICDYCLEGYNCKDAYEVYEIYLNSQKTKVCRKCGESKPETEEYFNKNKNGKGWVIYCKECQAENEKQYISEGLKKRRDNQRNFRKNNRDRVIGYSQKYRSKRKELLATLTTEQWEDIKNTFDNRCCYCGKERPLAQEHFVAQSKGGEYTLDNIVPSCKSCNSSKGDKDFFEWYPTYKYYSKKREKFILDFLGYKNSSMQQLKVI